MPEPTTTLSRRTLLGAGLASFCTPAFAEMRDGTHFAIADLVRGAPEAIGRPLRIVLPAGSAANLVPVARQFTDLTGIDVELDPAGVHDVASNVLIAHLEEVHRYDFALPATYDIPDLVAAGALVPMDDIELPGRVPPSAAAIYSEGDSFDGKHYGYQTDGDTYLVFLNRNILEDRAIADGYEDAYGARFAAPESWGEFDRQVAYVSSSPGDAFGALLPRAPGYVEWEFWLRFLAKGVWPFSPEFRPQIAGDAGVEALEDMLALSPFLAPDASSHRGLSGNWQSFQTLPIYMTFGWGGAQKLMNQPGKPLHGRLSHAVIPGGDGPNTPAALPCFNWGWSYSVVSRTEMPAVAKAFALFAVSSSVSTDAVRQADGFFDPFRDEHYRDPDIRAIYGDAFLETHRASLANAIPDLYIADRGAFFSTLGMWLRLVLDGVVPPAEGLTRVSQQWELLTDRLDRAKQAERWLSLRRKFPDRVAANLRDLVA
ncbi:extracellular solute-binding protein [Alphaproteobacteria bacterium GH1-50]|uniref:Extracellular solute-binding protein n=1 Tax=Kangsaoukella pontilimi TaxID=2691042 RepID=A0A7C9MU87_9RHOB|nr:extracellular solute-binding protein [Kangsaoukella pontilimi]MXQ06720.1 extracellular solute-binding protein [Kangsaoukella pontilimi]